MYIYIHTSQHNAIANKGASIDVKNEVSYMYICPVVTYRTVPVTYRKDTLLYCLM